MSKTIYATKENLFEISNLIINDADQLKFLNIDSLVTGEVALLLTFIPALINKVNTHRFSGGDWSLLLAEQPQLIKFSELKKLDGNEWEYLLSKQPVFIPFADFSLFSSSNFLSFKKTNPNATITLNTGVWAVV